MGVGFILVKEGLRFFGRVGEKIEKFVLIVKKHH